VKSLSRIRAIESPPGSDGLKTVWHQGAQGADLLSYVDVQGRVRRQELTLLDDYLLWTGEHGLRTGHVVEDGGSMAAKGSATVTLDAHNVSERLLRSHDALSTYSGEDKYIRHVLHVLGLVVQGLSARGEKTVTRAISREMLEPVEGAAAGGTWWVYAVVAIVFGALGFAGAFIATR
jgi:hypothetical protein